MTDESWKTDLDFADKLDQLADALSEGGKTMMAISQLHYIASKIRVQELMDDVLKEGDSH